MKAEHLRIGNWIVDRKDNRELKVLTGMLSNWDYLASEFGCKYEGIPLTEEWLEKFSFKKIGGWTWEKEIPFFKVFYYVGEKGVCLNSQSWTSNIRHIDQVHKLQNLVHAISGYELETKEK